MIQAPFFEHHSSGCRPTHDVKAHLESQRPDRKHIHAVEIHTKLMTGIMFCTALVLNQFTGHSVYWVYVVFKDTSSLKHLTICWLKPQDSSKLYKWIHRYLHTCQDLLSLMNFLKARKEFLRHQLNYNSPGFHSTSNASVCIKNSAGEYQPASLLPKCLCSPADPLPANCFQNWRIARIHEPYRV